MKACMIELINLEYNLISLILISYKQNIILVMDRSYSDVDFHADRMINRSCNQKIQDDILQSQKTSTVKFKASKSQNQLKTFDGQVEMDALAEKWKRNQQEKQKLDKDKIETNRATNKHTHNVKKKTSYNQASPKMFRIGADLVNSQEISIDDELLGMEDHFQKSQNSKKYTNQQMKIIEERRRKEMQQLITLNILILGKSGVGKTSFIDCFSNKNYENSPIIRQRTEIMNVVTVRNELDNFEVKLIDMPGYEESKVHQYMKDVEDLINKRFEAHLKKISDRLALRSEIKDERIHCCLYFLSGPWICESDWVIMKKIENITNIIPIVAKGDTFTTREIKQFKKKIFQRNKMMNVNWFSIEEILRQYHKDKLKPLLEGTFGRAPPFVITCCTQKQYNQCTKKHELVRDFRWGKCQLNNEAHNDFKFLKSLLMYYLSDLLIKYTDLSMRSFQQKMIQNRLKEMEESKEQENEAGRVNLSQSREGLKHEEQISELIKRYLPIGLTLAGLIGVYYWITKSRR